jgi:sarcosine oxidase
MLFMMEHVIVVGAGIMGSSAAWHLARRGIRVTLLEQFTLGHHRGSSHGRSRIFRFAYEQEEYVRLAQEALPLWREIEDATGTSILETTGGLDIGPIESLAPIEAALSAGDAPYEILSADSLRRRFPAFRAATGA